MMRGKGFESSVAASSAGVVARPGRAAWPLLQILCRQSTISPSASRSASISIAIAAPNGRVRHLVCARPLHAHRPSAGRLREQDRVEGDIVGGVVAVAAGALQVFDRDVFERQFEHQRKIGAEKVDALAVGPDMDPIARPLRHGAGRRDRSVRDIGAAVLPADRAASCRSAGRGLLSMTVSSTGWAFSHSASPSSSGRASPADHVAPLRSAQARLRRRLRFRSRRRRNFRRARSRGGRRRRARPVLQSSLSLAPEISGRITRPCSMPGNARS